MTNSDFGYCEFKQINQHEVACPDCGRGFSGTPEYYANRIICTAKTTGPGSELESIFKWWSHKLGITFNDKCPSCYWLKAAMDLHGKEWVRENIDKIQELLLANAAAQNVNVPKIIARKWLNDVSR